MMLIESLNLGDFDVHIRGILAVFTSFMLAFLLGPYLIRYLKKHGAQPIRENGPATHIKTKSGTPTMGGLLIIIPSIISSLLLSDASNQYLWIIIATMLLYAGLGIFDDLRKLRRKNVQGIKCKAKLLYQFLCAFCISFMIENFDKSKIFTTVSIPFFHNHIIQLGMLYYVFSAFIVVGSSNAVNLTDGLDGLASGPIVLAFICFAIMSCIIGNAELAEHFNLRYIEGTNELFVICTAFIGATLGFLWYNANPAIIFMGDTGSLSVGAVLGTMSIILKNECMFFVVGGVFVIEAMSVILQVSFFKCTNGKRIFLMAPIHHHFEKRGWSEGRVVMRFWIIAFLLAILGLSTLQSF